MVKDVFEAFYTKRLLFGTISSYELENKIIKKFKAECGTQYTKKSEDIFKDYETSKALKTDFPTSEQLNQVLNLIPLCFQLTHDS